MMQKMIKQVGVLCLGVCLVGCQQPTRLLGRLDQTQVAVIDYASNRRGAYVIAKKDGDQSPVLIITEPAPDTALAYQTMIQASVQGLDSLDATVQADLTQQVINLAKRSQTLQIQREALYRLNVLLVNGSIAKQHAAQLYLQVLKSIQVLALTELANADLPPQYKSQMVSQAAKHLFKDVQAGTWTNPYPGQDSK